jgi:hypothetical protein
MRKRKGENRAPLTNEWKKYKQLTTFTLPQRINNSKAYPNEDDGFVSCSVENLAENVRLGDISTTPGQCNKSYPRPMKETYLRNSEEVIFTIVTPKWLVDRYAQAYAIKKAKGIEDKPS